MSDSLNLMIETFEGLAVLRIKGKLVYGQNFQPLYKATARLRNEGHQKVIVDLTNVESADSTGISALLEVRRIIGEQPAAVILLRPSDRLRASLAMIRVSAMFGVMMDEGEIRRPS
jgi:anti-anti-sigma factor